MNLNKFEIGKQNRVFTRTNEKFSDKDSQADVRCKSRRLASFNRFDSRTHFRNVGFNHSERHTGAPESRLSLRRQYDFTDCDGFPDLSSFRTLRRISCRGDCECRDARMRDDPRRFAEAEGMAQSAFQFYVLVGLRAVCRVCRGDGSQAASSNDVHLRADVFYDRDSVHAGHDVPRANHLFRI